MKKDCPLGSGCPNGQVLDQLYKTAIAKEGRANETGWLVEWPSDGHQPVRWWHPRHGWTIDASAAIRFVRKQDAGDYIAGSTMKWAIATEHSWAMEIVRECEHKNRGYRVPSHPECLDCGATHGWQT